MIHIDILVKKLIKYISLGFTHSCLKKKKIKKKIETKFVTLIKHAVTNKIGPIGTYIF